MSSKRLKIKSLLDDFRPLTHIEIEQGKPLRVKLTKKLIFITKLQTVDNFLIFNQNKNYILTQLQVMAESKTRENKAYMLAYYRMSIDLIYEIAEKPRGIFKRWLFHRAFYKFLLDDTESLFNLFQTILDYNTRLFFLLKNVVDHSIFQQRTFTKISAEPFTVEPKTWEPRFT